MRTYSPKPIKHLESNRLVLDPLQMFDAPIIQRLFNDFEVLKYMATAVPWPYPDNGAAEFVARKLPRVESMEEYYWAIRLKDKVEIGLVGVIGLTPTSDDDHRGFWLGREFWGRGIMREATNLVSHFAFDELEMEFLLLNNAEPNVASHRLKKSAGAEIIGIEPHGEFIGGIFPRVAWKLAKDQWRKSLIDQSV